MATIMQLVNAKKVVKRHQHFESDYRLIRLQVAGIIGDTFSGYIELPTETEERLCRFHGITRYPGKRERVLVGNRTIPVPFPKWFRQSSPIVLETKFYPRSENSTSYWYDLTEVSLTLEEVEKKYGVTLAQYGNDIEWMCKALFLTHWTEFRINTQWRVSNGK